MDAAPATAPERVEEAKQRIAHVPLVLNRRNFSWLTERISEVVEQPAPRWWWVIFTITASAATFGLFCIGYQISTGVGTWGNNVPVGWAWDITNFVFWIGIGHAGTLISAILFLLRQKWRTSINRSAEAMTLFAVICAAIFPGIHVGRFWMAWYLAPLRDRATTKIRKFVFGFFALGWRGANRHWRHYEMAYLLLAGLSTPLVLSVHSVVSFDFATSVLPTWHTTIFPPYFVAGAIFGGFAMVLTLLIPARALYKLQDVITPQHIDKMAKIILLTGSFVAYAYTMEFFVAWYSGNSYERFAFWNRIFGPYWWYWWLVMLFCNCLSPQFFWFRWCRRNILVVFFVAMCVNAGMWFARFIIIAGGLARDFLPSSWRVYHPTWVDIWTYIGTIGIFTSLFLLFIRFLPMIAMSEVKTATPEADPHYGEAPEIESASPGGKERTR